MLTFPFTKGLGAAEWAAALPRWHSLFSQAKVAREPLLAVSKTTLQGAPPRCQLSLTSSPSQPSPPLGSLRQPGLPGADLRLKKVMAGRFGGGGKTAEEPHGGGLSRFTLKREREKARKEDDGRQAKGYAFIPLLA